jgi:hypothetical protein
MIDPLKEKPIALRFARRHFPRRRGGKRPALATLYRWSCVGYNGVILETIQVASTRCTTREAIARWIARVSEATHEAGCNARTPRGTQSSSQPRQELYT